MKTHQPSLPINQQIQNLRDIGLVINDETYAQSILSNISYFRLVKAYSLGLKSNGKYIQNVRFEDLVELYMFNAEFRHLLFVQIERIEVSLRCRISNYFSDKYGILGYKNIDNFENKNAQIHILQEIENEIMRNRKSPFIRNFRENYEGGDIPFYAVVEVLSFGCLSKCYKNMKNIDKKHIAEEYHLNFKYLESWIESISFIRNICDHYGRLYNARFPKKPKLYKQYSLQGIYNGTVFAVLICMKHILNGDDEWIGFVDKLSELFLKYTKVNMSTMGFMDNWISILK
ncbi:MAG: Abi family protein [bacterium]|nr:Abi family protein [bacterium]